jgi:hypothetical protein
MVEYSRFGANDHDDDYQQQVLRAHPIDSSRRRTPVCAAGILGSITGQDSSWFRPAREQLCKADHHGGYGLVFQGTCDQARP